MGSEVKGCTLANQPWLMIYMCIWRRSQIHILTFIRGGFFLRRRSIIKSLSFLRSFRSAFLFVVSFLSAFPSHLYKLSRRFRSPSRYRYPARNIILVSVLGPSLYRKGISILTLHISPSHFLWQQGWDNVIKIQGCNATYCNNQNVPRV